MERGPGGEPCRPILVGDLGVPRGQYRTKAGYNVRHADRATCSRLFKLMEHVRQLNEGSLLSIRHGQPLHLRGSRLRGWHAPRLDRVSRRQRLECLKQSPKVDTRKTILYATHVSDAIIIMHFYVQMFRTNKMLIYNYHWPSS